MARMICRSALIAITIVSLVMCALYARGDLWGHALAAGIVSAVSVVTWVVWEAVWEHRLERD